MKLRWSSGSSDSDPGTFYFTFIIGKLEDLVGELALYVCIGLRCQEHNR